MHAVVAEKLGHFLLGGPYADKFSHHLLHWVNVVFLGIHSSIGDYIGTYMPRVNRVNLNIAAFEFFGKTFGKATHSKLGGVIHRLVGYRDHAKNR